MSDKESAETSGDVSEPSEHEVELPDIESPRSSDRESMDVETGPILSRTHRSSETVDRKEKKEDTPLSPMRSDVSFDFGGSPHGSVDMKDDKNVTIRKRRSTKSTGKDTEKANAKEKAKTTAKTHRRESSGGRGFDEETVSPFSMNDGPLTPLSNGSLCFPTYSDWNYYVRHTQRHFKRWFD